MKASKILLTICVVSLAVASCASQSSVLLTAAQPEKSVKKTQRSFLWGVVSSDKTWDPREKCPYGISKMNVESVYSLAGFYASYDLIAWCAAPSAPAAGMAGQPGSVIIIR
jgi:hypothetical protein